MFINVLLRGGCGSSSGYKQYLLADDDNGNLNDGTPHMQAIYKAFNDQQIACNTPTVQDSGCAGTPTDAPVVSIVEGNMKATLTWGAVPLASKYQVFRTEGMDQCEQGKVLLATLDSSILTYEDTGLANGREYYYVVIPKGTSESCFGPSSDCASVTPVAGPEIVLSCENDPLVISIVDGETPSTESLTCSVYGIGGYTGTLSITSSGCDSSSLTGLSCAITPSTVSVTSTEQALTLTVVPTSSASGSGSIIVTASDGSLMATSVIPVSVVLAGDPQVATYDSTYKAPRCAVFGSECSSGDLLDGRGTISGGNEENAPNTINNICSDGNSGTYHVDESIDKIVVRSGFVDGTGEGSIMRAGDQATITATVWAWGSTGSSDSADFYYATDDNVDWTYIGTKKPTQGDQNVLSIDYELPQAKIHRVRVHFRYNGSVRYGLLLSRLNISFSVDNASHPFAFSIH